MEPKTSKPSQTNYGSSLGDIKNLRNSLKEKFAEQIVKDKIEITHENIVAVWEKAMLEMLKRKLISKSMLQESEFEIAENVVKIVAPISVYDYIKNERLYLLDIFKNHYHNEDINILIVEKPQTENETQNHVLSTREVFEQMAQRNPHLQLLKDRLRMDFEM